MTQTMNQPNQGNQNTPSQGTNKPGNPPNKQGQESVKSGDHSNTGNKK
jgi:hypothetical protein